jgi:hypothetical protein
MKIKWTTQQKQKQKVENVGGFSRVSQPPIVSSFDTIVVLT